MVVAAVSAAALALPVDATQATETLRATGALPVHITGRFQDPVGYGVTTTGEYIVLDRRGHTVYVIDSTRKSVRQTLTVGFEPGKLFVPGALAIAGERFAVSDAPRGFERVQVFNVGGQPVTAFYVDEKRTLLPRLTIGPLVLNGVGSMAFTGSTFLISRLDAGGLFVEHDLFGRPTRTIGQLRRTGHEATPHLHLAHNVGIPLADPNGGFYFVFQTGRPMLRKYDAAGQLVFERHIEGPELDPLIQTLPDTWPTREVGRERLPIVNPLVRAAAVDPDGRVWISLTSPTTYVYNSAGDKVRTVRLQSASGLLSPSSLFFAADGRLLVTPGCYEFTVR